jgi:perosamine synthetase
MPEEIVKAVLRVTGGPVPSHKPYTELDDVRAVMDQAKDLSCYGPINAFENRLNKACGRNHCVATSSGTAALEVALTTVGVMRGDLVAIPAISFVAAANAVIHRGAVPVFVDVDPEDFGMDPASLRAILSRNKIAAVVAVHVLGHPCRIIDISMAARVHGVPMIEDAAEALGSCVELDPGGTEFPEVHPCGLFGDISVLSFNLNKIVTTGGGGAVLTDDVGMAEHARHLATTARVADPPWEVRHDAVAWNHRISMLAGALGASQVQRLPALVAAKRGLARAYQESLERVPGVKFHGEPRGTLSNFWLPAIMVPPEERVPVLTALNDAGLGCRALFTPIDQLPPHKRGTHCPTADDVYRRTVCLPAGIELARRFA